MFPLIFFSSCAGKVLKCALLKKSKFVLKKYINFMCGIILRVCSRTNARLGGDTDCDLMLHKGILKEVQKSKT